MGEMPDKHMGKQRVEHSMAKLQAKVPEIMTGFDFKVCVNIGLHMGKKNIEDVFSGLKNM